MRNIGEPPERGDSGAMRACCPARSLVRLAASPLVTRSALRGAREARSPHGSSDLRRAASQRRAVRPRFVPGRERADARLWHSGRHQSGARRVLHAGRLRGVLAHPQDRQLPARADRRHGNRFPRGPRARKPVHQAPLWPRSSLAGAAQLRSHSRARRTAPHFVRQGRTRGCAARVPRGLIPAHRSTVLSKLSPRHLRVLSRRCGRDLPRHRQDADRHDRARGGREPRHDARARHPLRARQPPGVRNRHRARSARRHGGRAGLDRLSRHGRPDADPVVRRRRARRHRVDHRRRDRRAADRADRHIRTGAVSLIRQHLGLSGDGGDLALAPARHSGRAGPMMQRSAPLIAVLLLAAALPYLAATYYMKFATKVLILGILAMALNLVVGFGGLVSLCHAAFYGIAGYVLAVAAPKYEPASLWLTLPLAVAAASAAALVLGALSLRTRGVYFIMVTLAFGEMLFYFFHDTNFAGGSDGAFINLKPEAMLFGVNV